MPRAADRSSRSLGALARPDKAEAANTLFPMDRLWAMEVFVRVAEARSFSRAAESLDLANATVSACVRNLESHLGVVLVNRDTRRVSLTEAGERLLPQARALLEQAGLVEEEVRASRATLRGSLLVEVPISLGNQVIGPALPAFVARYPDIEVAMRLTNQPHHMIEHAIDVAIRMDGVEDDDLVARPLFKSRYVVCCAPARAAALPAHPRELDPRICLGVLAEQRRRSAPWSLRRGAERVQIDPRGPVHLSSSDAVLQAARADLGVAHVLEIFTEPLLAERSLVRVYADWETRSRSFHLVATRAGLRSARVRAFASFVAQLWRDDAQRLRVEAGDGPVNS